MTWSVRSDRAPAAAAATAPAPAPPPPAAAAVAPAAAAIATVATVLAEAAVQQWWHKGRLQPKNAGCVGRAVRMKSKTTGKQ